MTYWSYIKDNNMPRYVHYKSNHRKSVIRNIPKGVNKRLSENSANEDLFNSAVPVYQEAFKNDGYDFQLNYEPQEENNNAENNNNRNIRNVISTHPFLRISKQKLDDSF